MIYKTDKPDALGWLLQKAPWIVPIPGTTKLSHLELIAIALVFRGWKLESFEKIA